MTTRRLFQLVLSIGVATSGSAYAATVPFNIPFDTSAQYSSNFRTLFTTSGSSLAHNSGSGSNGSPGFVRYSGPTATGVGVPVYDTTPGDAGTTRDTFLSETVRGDFRVTNSGDSVGFYIRVNGATENAGYLGLLNISATAETLRILSSAATTPNTGGAGTAVATDSATDFATTGTWYTLEFAATNVGANVQLDLKVFSIGGTTPLRSISFTDTTMLHTGAGEIGVRLGDNLGSGSTSVDFDNFTVNVPEPTSITILALTSVGLLARRRRTEKK